MFNSRTKAYRSSMLDDSIRHTIEQHKENSEILSPGENYFDLMA
jgi:hypothetical protein